MKNGLAPICLLLSLCSYLIAQPTPEKNAAALRTELEQTLNSQPWDYDPVVQDRIEEILRTLQSDAQPVLVPKISLEHLDGKGYYTAVYVVQLLGRYGSAETAALLRRKYTEGYVLDFPSLIIKSDLLPEKQAQIESSLAATKHGLATRLRLALAASIVRLGDDTYFDSVLAGLADPDAETARAAIACLGWTGRDQAVETLARLASDDRVRGDAVSFERVVIALGDTRNPTAIPVLAPFVGISQPGAIRNQACRALARIGGPEGMAALRRIWECAPMEDNALIRMSTEGMLAIDRDAALDYLTQVLKGNNPLPAVKALYSLGLLKIKETTPAVVEILKEP